MAEKLFGLEVDRQAAIFDVAVDDRMFVVDWVLNGLHRSPYVDGAAELAALMCEEYGLEPEDIQEAIEKHRALKEQFYG